MGVGDVIAMYMGTELVYADVKELASLSFSTSTDNQTVVVGQGVSDFIYMVVDGVMQSPSTSVTFSTAGTHVVSFYTIKDALPDYAFSGSDATAITVTSAVTSCGVHCFSSTPNLEYIYGGGSDDNYFILSGVCYGSAEAGIGQTAEVPYGVTRLEHGAFYGNTTIQTLNLPTTFKTVADYAFRTNNTISKINARGTYPMGNCPFHTGGEINIGVLACATINSTWYNYGWTINLGVKFDAATVTSSSTTGGTTTAKTKTTTISVSNVTVNQNDEFIAIAHVRYSWLDSSDNTHSSQTDIYVDSNNNMKVFGGVLAPDESMHYSLPSQKNYASVDITNKLSTNGTILHRLNYNSSNTSNASATITI